jgi:hypothetical protein
MSLALASAVAEALDPEFAEGEKHPEEPLKANLAIILVTPVRSSPN